MNLNEWTVLIYILKYYHKLLYLFFSFYYKIKYQIEDDSADSILNACNSSNCDNQQIYRLLRLYLLKCGNDYGFIKKSEKFNEIVKAKFLGNILIISTSAQSKMDSFILFIDSKENKVIHKEHNLGYGIISLRLLNTPTKFKEKLLEVKYLKGYGTGFVVQNIRIFFVSDNAVFSIFDKTVFEVVSGWKAFKGNDTAEFKIEYKLSWNKGLLHLITDGCVGVGNKEKQLPEEIYVYDEQTRRFKQLEGRESSNLLLSEIYGDLANPNADWFVKPQKIKEEYSIYNKW